MVHLVKQFPRKILGKKKLNYEELLTFVMEVEGVNNPSLYAISYVIFFRLICSRFPYVVHEWPFSLNVNLIEDIVI